MDACCEIEDLASMTEAVLAEAIVFCACKVHLCDPQAARDRLRAGDHQVCEYCNYSLAKQVAASLGALDNNVQAAYLYDCDVPIEGCYFDDTRRALPIHLIVWTNRKTAALNAVVETWDRALTQRYAELIGGQLPGHLLDVQVVDSTDVAKRIGYGAIVTSLLHPPTEVWRR